MAPTQVRDPFHRDGWIYEEKVDGWRIVAYKDGTRVRLVSRNGRDHGCASPSRSQLSGGGGDEGFARCGVVDVRGKALIEVVRIDGLA